jgi:hypothetical protein
VGDSAQIERSGFSARRGLRWRTNRGTRAPPARKAGAINCVSGASCVARNACSLTNRSKASWCCHAPPSGLCKSVWTLTEAASRVGGESVALLI